jgi:ribosomal protein S18 acetylase RimI-like enzyme
MDPGKEMDNKPDLRMLIRPYQPTDESAVIDLWHRCGLVRPWNDPKKDIARKLLVRPDLFIVGINDDKIVATAMAGYEGHRGWINYLAVAPEHRREGFARQIMEHAEKLLREAGCPKINLQVRSSNSEVIEFYRRIGYAVDDVVSMGKRLIHDTGET